MKNKIITLFSMLCIAFGLAGCTQSTWLYRASIQQGNLFTPDTVQKLHLGMTKEAVCDLLGPPILVDTFNDNRWTYMFTFKSNKRKFMERCMVLYFRNDRVYNIKTKSL
jgi:outer membrane protein assembly factor BamE